MARDLEGLDFSQNPQSSNTSDDEEGGGAPLTLKSSKPPAKTDAWERPSKPGAKPLEGELIGGTAQSIGAESKGYKMLNKMGWSLETGLGAQSQGALDPVDMYMKSTKHDRQSRN